MIAVIQLYIGIRKGVDVDIKITSPRDMIALTQAYSIASSWMRENNVKIQHV